MMREKIKLLQWVGDFFTFRGMLFVLSGQKLTYVEYELIFKSTCNTTATSNSHLESHINVWPNYK